MTLYEKEMILSWRNDKIIKKWMYKSEDITLDNHLEYIETLESSNSKQYCVVKKDNIYIGVVDFTNINFENSSTDFGLYANPFEKIAGVGRILEEICIKYAFNILKLNTLKLEVFSENVQVVNLHKKFKFKEVDKKVINGKDVICMELKRS
ncbi:MAG: UDP-4-amino-4,6-dideoxy-N-acetyl-beta-L-altrosamine N-acetyltransferase [Sulfurovum sp.]